MPPGGGGSVPVGADVVSKPGAKVYMYGVVLEDVAVGKVAVKSKGGITMLGVTRMSVKAADPVQMKPKNSISVVVIGGTEIVVTVVTVTTSDTPLTIVSKVSSIVSVLDARNHCEQIHSLSEIGMIRSKR